MLVHVHKLLYCVFAIVVGCAARVTLRFPSKERGMRVRDRAFFGSRSFFRAAKTEKLFPQSFLGLSLLQNHKEMLATKATIVDKPIRHLIFFDNYCEERISYLFYEKPLFAVLTCFEKYLPSVALDAFILFH